MPRGPYNATPIFVKEGRGAVLVDVDGNRLLDFAGGIGCMNVGHANAAVVRAAAAQARGAHARLLPRHALRGLRRGLAERLNALVPGDFPKKTLFVNSGAEAVENAVKIARAATGRPAVLAFEDGFHGRTLLALTLTSKVSPYKAGFGPFAPEVYRVPYAYCYRCAYNLTYPSCALHCVDALEDVFKRYVAAEQVAAVIVEPVLGEGGFVSPAARLAAAAARADRAARHPADRRRGADRLRPHGPAVGGRAHGRRAGPADRGQVDRGRAAAGVDHRPRRDHGRARARAASAARSAATRSRWRRRSPCSTSSRTARSSRRRERDRRDGRRRAWPRWKERFALVGDVRGLGAMWAIELVRDRAARTPAKEETAAVAKTCYERGLVTITAGTYGNVHPHAHAAGDRADDELDEGLDVLEGALADVQAG